MKKMREEFNKLPKTVKVIIYSGISVFIGLLVVDLEAFEGVIYTKYIVVPLTVLSNIILYLLAREKESPEEEDPKFRKGYSKGYDEGLRDL